MLGLTMVLLGCAITAIVAWSSLPTSRMIGAMAFSNILFGRAASMSIGYAGGYGHALVVPVNMFVETVLVLLFYPVFVMSMRKMVEFPRLKNLLERTHAAAERHHETVRRYGIFGLFAFVCMPFWITGPVLGCAIGYLLGFAAWQTLLIVLVSTYIAIAGWAWVLFNLYAHAAALGQWAPALIIAAAILLILAAYVLKRHRA